MRNNKGVVGIALVFQILFAAAFGVAMLTRPQHIIKRSVEKCMAEGGSDEACVNKVSGWTQEERIEYIRDKATGPATQNFNG